MAIGKRDAPCKSAACLAPLLEGVQLNGVAAIDVQRCIALFSSRSELVRARRMSASANVIRTQLLGNPVPGAEGAEKKQFGNRSAEERNGL